MSKAGRVGREGRGCIKAMLAVTDARFQDGLAERARHAGKLARDFEIPEAWRANTPGVLGARLAPFHHRGLLPDYPFGSDFNGVEQRLVRALSWLRLGTDTRRGRVATLLAAMRQRAHHDEEAVHRMGLARPRGLRERVYARLVSLALARTRPGTNAR